MKKTSVSKQRIEDVLSGLDRLAAQASLSQLTSRRLSEMAGVAEGVMFRLFNGMDGILEQWIESRGGRLLTLITGAPANRAGFLRMLRSLLEVPELLGLLFDELKGSPAILARLDALRLRVEEQLSRQLQCLAAPGGGGSLLFADHLWVSLRRSWDPRMPDREERRERLLNFLPGEMNGVKPSEILPNPALLQRLAINESGFVFDPVSGRSFTVNESGHALLHLMMREMSVSEIIEQLAEKWDVEPRQEERDLLEFAAELRKAFHG
jgi:AcrR family transcriptional regulator